MSDELDALAAIAHSSRGRLLTRTLSVLLPVHNAQATLEADIGQMLDVLPELTHDFHLMILDDGSTDATCEVARADDAISAGQIPPALAVPRGGRRDPRWPGADAIAGSAGPQRPASD